MPSTQTLLTRALEYVPMGLVAPQDILTPEEVAQRLKVPVSWVYEKTRRRNKNRLPFFPLGRYIRFNWMDVVVWLEKQARTGKPNP